MKSEDTWTYLGGFPPPYGGVTIKNELLFKHLSERFNVKKSIYYSPANLLRRTIGLFLELADRKPLIIGLSNQALIKVSNLIHHLNKAKMCRSIVFVMGGTLAKELEKDPRAINSLSCYRQIFVETDGMRDSLEKLGLKNISVYPNCRESIYAVRKPIDPNRPLRCLYFSLISKDKGAHIVIDTASLLEKNNVNSEIDFYGHIEPQYQDEFMLKLKSLSNSTYKGVFKSSNDLSTYELMSSYDVLLFPTLWKNEGVPGVLVEAKFASLPAIVSDLNFNSEIVSHNIDGIVLSSTSAHELYNSICELDKNRDRLASLSRNAKQSAQKYIIDTYMDTMFSFMK